MAISPSDQSGWIERVHETLSETGISVSRGVSWLQNNLFRINLALETGFYSLTGYIYPDMTPNESGLYEQMYICDYYSKKANSALGAFAYDWTEIQGDKQGSIRRVSRNEIAKTYLQFAKDCKVNLAELIDWMKTNDAILLGQITLGFRDDVAQQDLMQYCPPSELYSNSTIWR